jgi:hypothetical protein
MTGKTRRSFLRVCCAGVAVGTLGGIETARAASSDDDEFVVEQARYISTYAAEGEWAFGELKPLFDPPSDEDLGQHLVDSVLPSISSFLPGLVGQAVELKETLDWYEAVGEDSGLYFVSETGCIEQGETSPTGGGGEGLRSAADELQDVVDQFATVDDRAQTCVDDPSTENVDRLVAAMETLTDDLDGIEWVERWSNVDSSAYQGRHPTAPQAAARLQGNAQVVLDVASKFGDVVADQRTAIRDRDYQPFPSAIVVYDRSVDEFRSNIPLFGTFTGDSYNIRTENEDGERLSVRWLDTGSSGAVADYELEQRDSANADVVLSESTLTDIVEADDSMAAAVDAYKTGEVEVNANGWGNIPKYGVFPKLINFIDNLI